MKRKQKTLHLALCVAVLAAPALAQESRTAGTSATTNRVHDVRLSAQGTVVGKVVNTAAVPVADAEVTVQFGTYVVARTRTATDGSFAIRGLRSGVHTISVGTHTRQCRLWSSNIAPPTAVRVLGITGDETAVRAQMGPPMDMTMVMTAAISGVIGGVIGYNIKDDDKKKTPASP